MICIFNGQILYLCSGEKNDMQENYIGGNKKFDRFLETILSRSMPLLSVEFVEKRTIQDNVYFKNLKNYDSPLKNVC